MHEYFVRTCAVVLAFTGVCMLIALLRSAGTDRISQRVRPPKCVLIAGFAGWIFSVASFVLAFNFGLGIPMMTAAVVVSLAFACVAAFYFDSIIVYDDSFVTVRRLMLFERRLCYKDISRFCIVAGKRREWIEFAGRKVKIRRFCYGAGQFVRCCYANRCKCDWENKPAVLKYEMSAVASLSNPPVFFGVSFFAMWLLLSLFLKFFVEWLKAGGDILLPLVFAIGFFVFLVIFTIVVLVARRPHPYDPKGRAA